MKVRFDLGTEAACGAASALAFVGELTPRAPPLWAPAFVPTLGRAIELELASLARGVHGNRDPHQNFQRALIDRLAVAPAVENAGYLACVRSMAGLVGGRAR